MEASGHALTGLLLTYPVHQACDILFCKANVVPIGKDNLPHVEQITRTIARRFNERYAKKNPVFPEPAAHSVPRHAEIPGLDGRKMSKSYGNSITLARHRRGNRQAHQEEPRPIPSAASPSTRLPARSVSALLTTAGAGAPAATRTDIAEEIGDSGAGALKRIRHRIGERVPGPASASAARELAKDMDYIA